MNDSNTASRQRRKNTNFFRKGVLFAIILTALLAALPADGSPAQAAAQHAAQAAPQAAPLAQAACTVPPGFNSTTRLHYMYKTQKDWTFEVEEPEMNVTLEFFWFQDYASDGCPFDCAAGDCQLDELGEAATPLGGFTVGDGKEGAGQGGERLSGRLPAGTYTASFWVTSQGSINVGMRVRKQSLPPTSTPLPPTPEPPTPTATDPVLPPPASPTALPTATLGLPTPTAPPTAPTTAPPTATDPVLPPPGAPTATLPVLPPPSTPTAADPVLPPPGAPTATPSAEPPASTPDDPGPRPNRATRTPPPTLPPPAAPVGTRVASTVIIPETGGDLSEPDVLLVFFGGITLLGGAMLLAGLRPPARRR